MKKLTLILFAILLLAGGTILIKNNSVFAEDPEIGSPEDNACNEGGSMWRENPADRCNTPWHWICGYYMARIESGEYEKGETDQLIANCLVEKPIFPPSHPNGIAATSCTATYDGGRTWTGVATWGAPVPEQAKILYTIGIYPAGDSIAESDTQYDGSGGFGVIGLHIVTFSILNSNGDTLFGPITCKVTNVEP